MTDLDVAICLGLLRAATQLGGEAIETTVLTADGAPAACSNGRIVVPACAAPPPGYIPDALLILSNLRAPRRSWQRLRPWIGRVARSGAVVAGADYGVQVMAACGLLDGHVATTHWDIAEAMREEFPRVRFIETLHARDRNRITCAGHLAWTDVVLELIGALCGEAVRRLVAVEMQAPPWRGPDTPQRIGAHGEVRAARDGRFLRAVRLMEESIDAPLALPDLAARVGLSLRQLRTVFLRETAQAPYDYYLDLRLDRGRTLLRFSRMAIGEVALACGFASASVFTRAFRARAGMPPRRYRALYANRLAPALVRPRPAPGAP